MSLAGPGGVCIRPNLCPECGGTIDNHAQACEECGLVVARSSLLNLTADAGYDENGGTLVRQDPSGGGLGSHAAGNSSAIPYGMRVSSSTLDRRKASAQTMASSLAVKLGIDRGRGATLRGVVDRQTTQQHGSSPTGATGRKGLRVPEKVAAAAAIAFVSRQTDSPLTFSEVAAQVGTSKESISSQFKHLSSTEPAATTSTPPVSGYIPRFVQTVAQSSTPAEYRALNAIGAFLGTVATKFGLADGRRPDAIAAACVALSLLAADLATSKTVALNRVTSALGLAGSTVTSRYRELGGLMVDYCKAVTRSGGLSSSHITIRNVHSHIRLTLQLTRGGLGDISLRELENKTVPPCYAVKTQREQHRRAKVESAYRRLKGCNEDLDESVDIADVELEERLLAGEDVESVVKNVEPPTKEIIVHHDLDDPNLTHNDLTDREFADALK